MRIKLSAIAAFFGAIAMASTGNAQKHAGEQDQPDILWILTDDHRPDSIRAFNRATRGEEMSPLGYVESPAADALAAEGVIFIQAYNQAPTCGPSRTSMLTGRYPFRNGKYGWESTHQEADFVRPAFSQIVQAQGYSTAVVGKTHFSLKPADSSDGTRLGDIMTLPLYQFEAEFEEKLQANDIADLKSDGAYGLIDDVLLRRDAKETVYYPDGRSVTYPITWADRELTAEEQAVKSRIEDEFDILRAYTRINTELILGGVNPQPAESTIDASIGKVFDEFIANPDRRYRTIWGETANGPDSSKPLYINLGFHFPHTPVLPPKSVRDRFKDKPYNIPQFDVDELASMPPQLVETYNESGTAGMKDTEKLQAIRDYYAFAAHGDALVGKAIETFKANAEARGREWLIIYTIGDHGWQLGEQGIMGKFGPWEQSLRGTVIVASSDKTAFPPGTVHDGFVEYVDFAPTIMAAAGVDLAKPDFSYLDGYDLAEVIKKSALKRDYILGEMNLVNGHRAYMRTKDFAFSMRTRDRRSQGPAPYLNDDLLWALETQPKKADLALYDLRVDPLERHNLATTLEYDQLAEWFRQKLGNIVLGDRRIEVDWSKPNSYALSNFAGGADDKIIEIPKEVLPESPRIVRPGPNR